MRVGSHRWWLTAAQWLCGERVRWPYMPSTASSLLWRPSHHGVIQVGTIVHSSTKRSDCRRTTVRRGRVDYQVLCHAHVRWHNGATVIAWNIIGCVPPWVGCPLALVILISNFLRKRSHWPNVVFWGSVLFGSWCCCISAITWTTAGRTDGGIGS